MKRHATTLVLLVLAVGLGIYVWRDRNAITETERKGRPGSVFSAWRRDDLSRLEITHEGETIILVRDARSDGAWRMTSPRAERVDQQAAERLTTTLEFATVVRKVGEAGAPGARGEQAEKLGFEAPRAQGSITMGTVVFHFTLGGPSPRPEGSSYFRVDDGVPFVASKELTETLLASSDTYRDRTVVPYLSLETARFEVSHPGGGFVVVRHDARSFDVDGLGLLASRPAVDKVWSALAEMRAEAFPKEADVDRLTASPRLTIRMTSKDAGKPVGELVVGDVCPGHPDDVVVLRRQPTRVAACAPKGAIEALLAITPMDLVDRRPFSFRHDEIEELRLTDLAPAATLKALEIARRGTGFHEREPADRELDAAESDAASELLVQMENTTAEVTRGGAPFVATARARIRSGEYEETVEVGDGVLRRVRDDARLAASPAVLRRFVPRATTLRSRVLLGDTRRVDRVNLRCGTAQDLVDSGAGLKLATPAGYETDGSIVQLVDGLTRGKVLAWVADRDDGTFGITPSGCRVVLAFADGNAPQTVLFGAAGDGGVYGTVDGSPGVFLAPLALEALARRIYVSHAALRVDPAQVEAVKVKVQGKPLLGGDPIALREAVGGLYADHAVTLASSDVGPIDLELTVSFAEGGPPRRIVCAPVNSGWRRCATPSVKAVFEVQGPSLAPFLAHDSDH